MNANKANLWFKTIDDGVYRTVIDKIYMSGDWAMLRRYVENAFYETPHVDLVDIRPTVLDATESAVDAMLPTWLRGSQSEKIKKIVSESVEPLVSALEAAYDVLLPKQGTVIAYSTTFNYAEDAEGYVTDHDVVTHYYIINNRVYCITVKTSITEARVSVREVSSEAMKRALPVLESHYSKIKADEIHRNLALLKLEFADEDKKRRTIGALPIVDLSEKQCADIYRVLREELNQTASKSIIVCGIDHKVRDNMLREAFSDFGRLVSLMRYERYARITFETKSAASNALCKMDGSLINGCCIVVTYDD